MLCYSGTGDELWTWRYRSQAGGEARPGQWREIKVELTRRKDLVVRTRLGYFSHSEQVR